MDTDPVTLEVIRNAFQSAAEEMGVTLTRTALSPNIKDRHDCSTAIYSTGGELIAQAEHIPLHLGLMPTVVKSVLKYYSIYDLSPGDVLIINDPYVSGSHLPDICMISPVYIKGKPEAVAANLAHHVDVGGIVPGSMSTSAVDIFQEGIRIPPIKICREGKLNDEVLELIANNVRTRDEFYGDVQAQIAANQVGVRRLNDLEDRFGLDVLKYYMGEIINYTEHRMRAGLKEVPSGTYSFSDCLEGDGISEELIDIKVKVDIGEENIKVDFAGTHPQVKGPVNSTRGVTLACVYFAVKAAVDPELPSNEGIARVVDVITPESSLVNPVYPAAVAHANINTAQRIADTVLGALAKADSKRVCAAGTGSMSNFTIGGKSAAQKHFSYVETYGGGQGAKYNQDGMDGVHVNMTNTLNTPVEVIEMKYPLLVEAYSLICDSGGAGKFRGGAGIRRVIRMLCDAVVAVSTERNRIRPWGLEKAGPGRNSCCWVRYSNSDWEEMSGKFTREMPIGTMIILETAGGGGFGNPLLRDIESVYQDVVDGLVSPKEAEEEYGLAFGDDLSIDYCETISLRENLLNWEEG